MKRHSLTKKLTRLFILSGLVAAFFISAIQQIYTYYDNREALIAHVNSMSAKMAPAIKESLWELNISQLKLQLEAIQQARFVSRVTLELPGLEMFDVGINVPNSSNESLEKLFFDNQERLIGKLSIFLDENELKAVAWQNLFSYLKNNVFVIAITATVLYLLLHLSLTQRLAQLVQTLRRVDSTHFRGERLPIDLREETQVHDEIDELTTTLEQLWESRHHSVNKLWQSENRLRLALDSTSDGLWDWNVQTGEVFYSDNWKTMLGFNASEIQPYIDASRQLIHPDDLEQVELNISKHFAGETEFYSHSHRMQCKDGSYKWVLDRGRVIEWNEDVPLRMVGTHLDITPMVDSQEQLQIAATVYEQASEGMMITNERVEIIDVNQAFTKITGYSKDDVVGLKPSILSSGKQLPQFYRDMWKRIKADGSWQGEICNKNKQGKEYIEWLSISEIRHSANKISGYIGIFTDITQIKEQEDLIYHQANYDSLTDLPNRRLFNELLIRKILQAKRHAESLWLLYVDIDSFKDINDTLGHEFGDQLLVQWAARVKERLTDNDSFARVGGDEFAILVSQQEDIGHIEQLANQLLSLFDTPFKLGENEIYTSITIGIAQFPCDGLDESTLNTAADQALHKAKQLGKNQHVYYTPELLSALEEKVRLAKKMRVALNQRQFNVFYQPIVRVSDNAVIKAEALVRWRDPDEGFISPAHFIPVAEETGLISSLTEYVVNEVLEKQTTWQSKYSDFKQISINISPVDFKALSAHKEKVAWFEKMMSVHLEPNSVLFEITEGVLMNKDPDTLRLFNDLNQHGIEIAIDDFGTGYSSLSYLHQFDIDYLKIDKSFVDQITNNQQIRALCEAMVSMAHKLGLRVIAEGVEEESQLHVLRQFECDFYQGYLCSPPIPPQEFEARFFDAEIKVVNS